MYGLWSGSRPVVAEGTEAFKSLDNDIKAYQSILAFIKTLKKDKIQERMAQRNERLRLGQQDDDVSIGEFRRLDSQFAEQNRKDRRLNQRLDFLSSAFSVQQNEKNALAGERRQRQQRERQRQQRQERSREGEELRRYEEYGKTRRY